MRPLTLHRYYRHHEAFTYRLLRDGQHWPGPDHPHQITRAVHIAAASLALARTIDRARASVSRN